MDVFLKYGRLPLKYQCTSESTTVEVPNTILGVYCIAFGAVFIPLYIICVAALIQRDLRSAAVYKIMILLSISDIIMLLFNSILTGFFFINGIVFCSYPVAIYIVGCVSHGCWAAACSGCLFLIFTRIVDLWSRKWHDILFGGRKAYVVILLCIVYALCFFLFPSPALFNAAHNSWIFDPMVTKNEHRFEVDSSWLVATNNLFTVTSTFALYFVFFISFLYKYHSNNSYRISSYEKQIFLQSSAICGINLSLALIYVYMMYFPVTIATTIAGLFLWQLSSAGAVVVYIGVNKTVRRKVLRMISRRKKATTVSVVGSTHLK